MRSHEAAWVAELLILVDDVDVLSVRVDETHLWANPTKGRSLVNATCLDIQTATATDAEVLARALHLAQSEPTEKNETRWNYWTGWCANASREVPVTIKVCYVEHVPALIPDGVAA